MIFFEIFHNLSKIEIKISMTFTAKEILIIEKR
jgi:hypothetical protein